MRDQNYAVAMILAWPLTTSTELAQVLRPGGRLRPDSALRSLRDKGLAAEAITVVPRSGRGAHGKVVWYSSLMIDVARLLRNERYDAARGPRRGVPACRPPLGSLRRRVAGRARRTRP